MHPEISTQILLVQLFDKQSELKEQFFQLVQAGQLPPQSTSVSS